MDDFGKLMGPASGEWAAFAISILSLAVAIFSMLYAKDTLHSQRKTERNTQPIMNEEVLKFLLEETLQKILNSYVFIFSLHYSLERTKYKTFPSAHFWDYVTIDTDEINKSVFYNNKMKYSSLRNMLMSLEIFNEDLHSLRYQLENHSLDQKCKICEIVHIYKEIPAIIQSYRNVLTQCFLMKEEDIEKSLQDNFFCCPSTLSFEYWKKKYNIGTQEVKRYDFDYTDSEQFLMDYIRNFIDIALCAGNLSYEDDYEIYDANKVIDPFLNRNDNTKRSFIYKLFVININTVLLGTMYHEKIIDFIEEGSDTLNFITSSIPEKKRYELFLSSMPEHPEQWRIELKKQMEERLKLNAIFEKNNITEFWFYYLNDEST